MVYDIDGYISFHAPSNAPRERKENERAVQSVSRSFVGNREYLYREYVASPLTGRSLRVVRRGVSSSLHVPDRR